MRDGSARTHKNRRYLIKHASQTVPALPLVEEAKAGKILLNPSVQVGYQHIGASMTLPASAVPRGNSQLFRRYNGCDLAGFQLLVWRTRDLT